MTSQAFYFPVLGMVSLLLNGLQVQIESCWLSPRDKRCCGNRDISPCWSSLSYSLRLGWTIDCFLPWQLAYQFLIPWKPVLREEAFPSIPDKIPWVLCSKHIGLWTFESFELGVFSNRVKPPGSRRQPRIITLVLGESLVQPSSTPQREASHAFYWGFC